MSAPDTNVKTQEKQHKGPLSGIVTVLGFVAVITVAFTIWVVANGNEPGEGEEASDTNVTATEAAGAPAAQTAD